MRRFALFSLIATTLTACAANDVIVQRQSSMEGRLEQIMQAQNSSKREITDLAVQVKDLKAQLVRRTVAENEALEQYEVLQQRLKTVAHRLEQLESPARQPAKIELVNNEAAAAGREEAVQAEYLKAFGLFSANNYPAAVEAFSAFIASHPESEYAANARYWLGECYFSSERYREAIDSFSRVLDMKPSARRAADALLKIGLAWKSLDEPAKTTTALRAVIDRYPQSEAAIQARQQLERK